MIIVEVNSVITGHEESAGFCEGRGSGFGDYLGDGIGDYLGKINGHARSYGDGSGNGYLNGDGSGQGYLKIEWESYED